RSLWEIIWSCVATLFACTWTAIHPNIPGMNEGKIAIISRRLGIMMMALIAPELMITWSTAQFISACNTAKDFNAFGWTVTHGFFRVDGWLHALRQRRAASYSYTRRAFGFIYEGSVEMPLVVEADIEDRSKGDALSKGIAILQLAWFIIQLAARYVQSLPITLLELDTLAVAALTSIAYGFWWKKPKDVGRPHAVYWKANTSLENELTYEYVVIIPV
ncbi:hypothetical protein BDR07DRAFT_1283676, partial [Suillus spraguei]